MSINCSRKIKYKTLPSSNIIAEEIIIGQMMLDTFTRQYIVENTVANFFALQKHKQLYNYTASIKESSIAATVQHLWDQKILQKIGGMSHVVRIVSKSQAALIHTNRYIYIKYCIKILQYNYIKRLFAQYSYSILQLNHFYHISIKQIQKKASHYLERVCENSYAEDTIEFRRTVRKLLYKAQAFSAKRTEILSGFLELDKITNGFKAGELIIVAGRPSMGKTSFAINIAHYAMFTLKLSVHIFSLEMSKAEILDKLVGLASDVSIRKIQQKIIEKHEWIRIQQACRFLLLSSMRINDQESSSIKYIKTQYSHWSYKKKPWPSLIIYN